MSRPQMVRSLAGWALAAATVSSSAAAAAEQATPGSEPERAALPMAPLLSPSSAAVAEAGTASVSGGIATGWTGGPRVGVAVGARLWPVRRVLVQGSVAQGVAELTCVACSGALGRVSVRANAVERDAVRLGLYGALDGTLGMGPTGSASAGPVLEGGSERLRLDLAAPLVSTVDILEDARSGWESGLTWHASPAHATRIGTVGPRFRPTVSHRFTSGTVWTTAEGLWSDDGPVLRLRAGIRL